MSQPPFRPVGRRDTDKERIVLRPVPPHLFGHVPDNARPVEKAAPILVGTVVRQWRIEFVQQIAVRGMDLDDLETRFLRPFRCLSERFHDLGNSRFVQWFWLGIVVREWPADSD